MSTDAVISLNQEFYVATKEVDSADQKLREFTFPNNTFSKKALEEYRILKDRSEKAWCAFKKLANSVK